MIGQIFTIFAAISLTATVGCTGELPTTERMALESEVNVESESDSNSAVLPAKLQNSECLDPTAAQLLTGVTMMACDG